MNKKIILDMITSITLDYMKAPAGEDRDYARGRMSATFTIARAMFIPEHKIEAAHNTGLELYSEFLSRGY